MIVSTSTALEQEKVHAMTKGAPTIYPANTATLDQVVSILMRYAGVNNGNVRFIDEYRRPTGHATGGHFHISWGQGTEGATVMKLAKKQVLAGDIEGLQV